MPITRINQFEAKPGSEEALYHFLHSVITMIQSSPGCLSCELLRGVENPAYLAIIEQWESLESHQAAAKSIPPEKLGEALALFAKPASGMYYKA